MTGRVTGKVAIITGAGSGIGRACMSVFAREGARVIGVARTQSALDTSLAGVRAGGGEGLVLAGDLADPATAPAIVAAAMDTYGRIDILVHAAGVGWSWGQKSPGSMDDVVNTSTEKWREVMAINLDACFYLCRAVVPIMQKQQGGAIVNVASTSGFLGLPTAHTYAAAKGAMLNLTRSLCVTYARDGIRANCIAPGYTDTPMVAAVLGVFDDDAIAGMINPMKRAGTPEEMAYGCLFLASDEASYCNGAVLAIDGGLSAMQ